jgi:hypothetical protein
MWVNAQINTKENAMSQLTLFVQIQGDVRILEITVAENITESELHNALSNAGVPTDLDLFVFIDESEEHISREGNCPVQGIKHGTRVHVARCRRIKVTTHFIDKTIDREFSSGTRIRSVKTWAVREFKLEHTDAAEHVLQICNSKERPASDTPLHSLVHNHTCALCFDLVPEKRVEGEE